jgi:hypothetical protein
MWAMACCLHIFPKDPFYGNLHFLPKIHYASGLLFMLLKRILGTNKNIGEKIHLAFIITLVKKFKNIAKQLEKYAINRYI